VTGVAAVQAAVGFTVLAPDNAGGLARQDVRLLGHGSGSQAVLVTYGRGPGTIAVVERRSGSGGQSHSGMLAGLPTVSLEGVSVHELSTQLGTVLQWQRSGVDFVLAGSVTAKSAESAASDLLR
jgi:hypothetical protein